MKEEDREKELEKIEEELLEEDRKKREEKMNVDGRSVFDIKKKKDDNEHNRH